MNVFIAGPRAISSFDDKIKQKLYSIYEKNYNVLVGDANGVDKSVQKYFFELKYTNVTVYASKGLARNNLGNWHVENVKVGKNLKGFDYYAEKDKAMAENADYGLMIWNGKSKGTLTNIINLVESDKKSLVYFGPTCEFIKIDSKDKLNQLISICGEETKELYAKIYPKTIQSNNQISVFDTKEGR